ncbi:MAG: hypothetical protein NDF54_07495 [archaeon GB-1867-035]|nr:hypothetical protein [Candidatus Culexmicrobium profundum]
MEIDVFRIYQRLGNFFRMKYNQGRMFESRSEPSEVIRREEVIFFEGKFYSYKSFPEARETTFNLRVLKSMITKQFALKLKNNGYKFKRKYIAYREEVEQPHKDIFSVFKGFEFRIILLDDQIFLCIDPHIVFKVNCSIDYLLSQGFDRSLLSDFSVSYSGEEGKRIDGYLIETVEESNVNLCRIKKFRDFTEVKILANNVFPEPRPELIQMILDGLGRNFNVISLQRKLSFLDSKTASKDRLMRTLEIVQRLKEEVFPLEFGEFKVELEDNPVVVKL